MGCICGRRLLGVLGGKLGLLTAPLPAPPPGKLICEKPTLRQHRSNETVIITAISYQPRHGWELLKI
jgi:hypothetical protein